MITSEIIEAFEQYVDDTTQLSPAQELALANKIYRKVLNFRPWEFLKKSYSAALSGTTYALPSDFAYLSDNYGYTESFMPSQGGKAVFILDSSGAINKTLPLVNWSDRMQYLNDDVAYIDTLGANLIFAKAQTSGSTIAFDYVHNPADLTLATSPIFPSRFHEIIYHGMAADDYICQQFPKAESYAEENSSYFKSYMDDMSYWNSQLIVLN